MRTQFNKSIKIVHSDNETEFTCTKSYFLEQEIIHQTTITRTL